MQHSQLLTEIPVLETERFTLRGVTPNDATKLFPMMSNKETMKFITPDPVKSEADMQEVVTNYLTKFKDQKEIPWVIINKETDEIIGQFRLHKLHLWHRKAEMGAVVGEAFQQKGVMTEVLQVILPFAFETLNLNRLVGDIFAENDGSRKLLEKFGFTKEGVLRDTDFDGERYHDTVVYSMLKKEYLNKITPLE
ncbi:GNAT family N-acetyltransferase [Ornithinibacillus californiensis]|uniref:GNAT family N-acetyltransferase n=1 Tax=Ornithinibacillus californiensis TaxID=161536 RepID=UPI00064D7ACA|nr:GNAT family protein [Ornithinibacillus californiensis]